jgi:iron(III) transport system substrate-binding protein
MTTAATAIAAMLQPLMARPARRRGCGVASLIAPPLARRIVAPLHSGLPRRAALTKSSCQELPPWYRGIVGRPSAPSARQAGSIRRHAMKTCATALGLSLAVLAGAVSASELNLYSSRHYDTDLALYEEFTRKTGIRVNLIEGTGDELLERIRAEGAASPADVLITVDAGRLWRAVEAGVLAPVESAVLEERIPAQFQHPENLWFGLTVRVRVFYYDKARGRPPGIDTYEALADPSMRGEICMRSSSNIYSVSLMAELLEVMGEEAALEWAKGLNANLARPPQGGDTDQLRAVAAGECWIGIGNTYYWGRLAASDNPADRAVAERTGMIFPNQADRGAHANISGAGVVATAPNRENAIKFLEYLTTESAQRIFADGNNEYPVVPGVTPTGPIAAFLDFRKSEISAEIFGRNAARAVQIWETAGVP